MQAQVFILVDPARGPLRQLHPAMPREVRVLGLTTIPLPQPVSSRPWVQFLKPSTRLHFERSHQHYCYDLHSKPSTRDPSEAPYDVESYCISKRRSIAVSTLPSHPCNTIWITLLSMVGKIDLSVSTLAEFCAASSACAASSRSWSMSDR